MRRVEGGRASSYANTYWFESQQGPIVVDVPMTKSEAKSLRRGLENPYRIFITAARAERFASLDVMREGKVVASTTPAVATEIKDYGGNRLAAARKRSGDDVPSEITPPSPSIEERTHDMLGEVEIELLPLGPAESASSLALYLPKTGELITGDVVASNEHLDLTWGRSIAWQDRINELKALNPKVVYPGHGRPGGPELLEQNLAYLKFFHDAVAARVKPGAPQHITAADKKQIKKEMTLKFPTYGRDYLLDRSIPAEYAVQLQALPPAATPAGEGTSGGAAPTAPGAANAPGAPSSTSAPGDAVKPAAAGTTDELVSTPAPAKKSKKKKKKTDD